MCGLGRALDKTGGYALLGELKEVSPHTARHSWEVARLAIGVGSSMPDLAEDAVLSLGFSGALHDVGKMNPGILKLIETPRKLDDEEARRVREVHTREGSVMIASGLKADYGHKDLIVMAAHVALRHHDKPSAQREDEGLVNADTAAATDLIHVIDMFEAAQATDRPYMDRPLTSSPEEAASWLLGSNEVRPFHGIEPDTVMAMLVDTAKRAGQLCN